MKRQSCAFCGCYALRSILLTWFGSLQTDTKLDEPALMKRMGTYRNVLEEPFWIPRRTFKPSVLKITITFFNHLKNLTFTVKHLLCSGKIP